MHLYAPNEDTLVRACRELGVTLDRFQEDVKIIKDWLRLQPHLPPLSDESLLCENMLLRCKGSVEMSKKAIDYNFSMRLIFPDFFGVQDPQGQDIQHLLDVWTNAPLEHLTSEGYRAKMYLISTQEDVCTHDMNTVVKLWMMQEDLELKEDVSLGEVYIHDLVHLGMPHIVRFTPTLLQNAFEVSANGCKSRLKSVHFLNAPPVVDSLLRIVKAILPKKLANRLHVHPNLESLHAQVDRAILPKEYGGDQKPLAELARDWRKKLESYREWFLEDAKGRVDESKRPIKIENKGNFFGYEGTFKKLQVD